MAQVSVVIPTWNGAELLSNALGSLQRQTWRDFEIVVVDNGSTDETAHLLSRDYPDIRLISFAGNRGFAAAVNAGIRAARGEIIVLMNNDTEAAVGWLSALVSGLAAHPEVAFCASKMLDYQDRRRIDSAGDQMGFHASAIGRGKPDGPEFDRPRYVFSASAGAAAYRRCLFEDIGFFDERFFAYYEDVDLGFRAQLAGHKCLYVPGAIIYHRGGATSSRISEARALWMTRNSLFLFFQNMPLSVLLRFGWYMLLTPLVAGTAERPRSRVRVRALLHFLADLPSVCRQRRRAHARRRVTTKELRSMLLPPVGSAEPDLGTLPSSVAGSNRAERAS